MFISIGGIVFSSIDGNGFSEITQVRKGEYKELALVRGAMSQRTGRGLDKITLTAQWLGLEAGDHISDLDLLLTGYHQMSDQEGNNLGLWTIDSYQDHGSDVFGGVTMCHRVTLSITEYR